MIRVVLTLILIANVATASAQAYRGPALRNNLAEAMSKGSYPKAALKAREQGLTVVDLAIDPYGAITGCTLVTSSGSLALDEYTCELAKKRVKFRAAENADGAPVAGIYPLRMRWTLP